MGVVHDFNNALEIWLARHGFANIEVCEGEDYQYYYTRHIIQWGMITAEKTNCEFAQFFHEYGLNDTAFHIPTLSFLHELGHAVTWSNFTEEEIDLNTSAKEAITNSFDYWLLPIEFSATMWAIDWVNTHQQEYEELQCIFASFFDLIYNDTDILTQINNWMDDVREGIIEDLFIIEE